MCENIDQLIECNYVNNSKKKQIIRIFDALIGLEKILEAGEGVTFEAQCESVLEVHDFQFITATLSERISCVHLVVNRRCLHVDERRWGILDQTSA